MRAAKGTLIFLGLMPLCLIACSNQSDYEIYSNCLLKTMNGQDKSMKHHAMESCESKHPYEKKIYWKNRVDFDFSVNTVQRKVLFKVRENNSDYRVTKVKVSGTYMACDNIPEEPSKPNYLFEYDYHEQAKAELGFDDKDFRTSPETKASKLKEFIQPEAYHNEKKFASEAQNENYLAELEETNRLMSKRLDQMKASNETLQRFHDEEIREKQLTIIRLKEYSRQLVLITERATAIKETEDQKKRLAYEVDLNEYKKAHSTWSSPVEIYFNKGIGEVDISNFGPFSSTLEGRMWAKGPRCMSYFDVHGVRSR